MNTRGNGRNKQFLLNKLRDMYGDDFDPVVKMSKNATTLQKIAESQDDDDGKARTAKDANVEWDRVAKYTTPQLKSIEINLDADVTNHEGLPEVDALVEDLLDGETDSHSPEDLSD